MLAAKSTLGVATERSRGRKALLATQPESLNCRPGSTLSASPLLPSPPAGSAPQRTGVVANFVESKRSGSMSTSASGATQTWVVDLLTSKRKYDGKLGLSLQFMDASGKWSDSVKIDKDWKEDTEAREKELQGTRHVGRVTLPEGVIPVAVALEQLNATEKDKTYVVKLELTSANSKTVSFPTQGYLTKGRRVFFDGKARLPADTPAPLAEARKKELDALKGLGNPAANDMRKGDERIYAFQVYNDLGDDKDIRPVLGGKEMPYPRRMRTGRPNYPGTPYEVKPEPRPLLPIPWMPLDDDFDTDKSIEFVGGAVTATLPALQLIFRRDKQEFKDIRDVLKLYDADRALLAPALPGLNPLTAPFRFIGNALFRTVRFIVWTFIRVRAAVRNGLGLGKNSLDVVGSLFKSFKDLDDVFEYPAPFNLAKTDGLAKSLGLPKPQDPYRVDTWRTDEEFGRQFLAGLNPLTIEALSTARPLPKTSAITLEALTAHLEGHALSDLLAAPKPRLFVVDLYDTFIDYLESINKEYTKPEDTRVQHAGHCVLYLRNDGYLVPIAIDLTSSKAKPPAVYTPADPGNVWNLAKAVFASIDSTHHQMMSHWLRTHACQEPFLIATHRNLSTMHPVYKLIMPHFRYTMPINAAARTLLVQAGGVVESNFTPGKYNLSLTSLWYSKHWRFETEALPADLQLRGLMSDEGEVLLDDFPYAQDGLLIWNALDKYFTQYIDLYYTSDADVAKDPEIQAWWTDIQSEGHPDKKEGWAPMTSKAGLVRALATMAWIGSGHHAAVNFGQYDYAAFMPNRSANTRKPMPVRGSPEYQALAAVKPSTDDGDRLLLTYLGGPLNTTQVATLCKALAGHAADEQYLSDPDQPLLTDPDAKAAHARFVTDILASEATIAQRNADPKYLTRNLNKSGLPYRYMIATSKPGLTGQGVPYSVSI